jgi:hypothetical protein
MTEPVTVAKKATKRVTFVERLFELVSDARNHDIVRFVDGDGDGFTVFDFKRLSSDVLPRHFKTEKVCSFIRQLSNYYFVALKNKTAATEPEPTELIFDADAADAKHDPMSWRHEHGMFVRARRDLLAHIHRRQSIKRSKEPRAVEDGGEPDDEHVNDEPFGDAVLDEPRRSTATSTAASAAPAVAASSTATSPLSPLSPPSAAPVRAAKVRKPLVRRQLADAHSKISEQERRIKELEEQVAQLRNQQAAAQRNSSSGSGHIGALGDLPDLFAFDDAGTAPSDVSSTDSPSNQLFDIATFEENLDAPFQPFV